MLRDDIPRSLRFCLRDVYDILASMCKISNSAEATRLAGEIYAALQFGRVTDIFNHRPA